MNLAVSDNIAIFAPFPHARMANFNVPYSTRLLDTLARVYVNVMLFYALHVRFEGDYKIWQFPVWSSVTLEINIKHTCTVTKQTINTSTAYAHASRTHPSALITTKHKHLAMRNVLLTNRTKTKPKTKELIETWKYTHTPRARKTMFYFKCFVFCGIFCWIFYSSPEKVYAYLWV